MLKWSTTRSNGKVIGEEIRRKLEAEKMSLEAMLRDDMDAGIAASHWRKFCSVNLFSMVFQTALIQDHVS